MDNEMMQKVVENRPAMIVISLATAAGAVLAIAGGFVTIYKVVTLFHPF